MTPDTLPAGFLSRLAPMLGDELAAFTEALLDPPDGLRVNTLRLDPEAFQRLSDFDLVPLEFPGDGFLLRGESRPGRHPYHSAGLYYLQDPGAMIAGALVGARPGEKVLDLSAAPGGKATQVAAAMRGEGLLVANDVDRSRAQELAGNLERCGVRNAVVTAESPDRLVNHFGAFFDRVLVDAPCSGESMFHKSAAARESWSEATVAGCARRQRQIVATAARLVRPGGTLVYSTCTFAPEENEEVVRDFLHAATDFAPTPLVAVTGAEAVAPFASDGRPAAYRLWPHRVRGAGHFIARFRRVDGEPDRLPRSDGHVVSKSARSLFERFVALTFRGAPIENDGLAQSGEELYAFPSGSPSLAGLRVVRSGVWLGTVKGDRFEPAHSLAMAMPLDSAADAVSLDVSDPRVFKYLRGEPIEVEGPPGWVPVGVDGFPLGWGKRVGATVKNHYPKGLRWRGAAG